MRLRSALPLLGAVAILLGFAALECAHLLLHDHYQLVNYDGYYFHFIAHQILEGTAIPVIGSGLAYPLVGLSHVVGLQTASLILPPLLGVLTGLVLFWGVTKLYSVRLGFLAVVCFVFAQIPRLFYLSGNLDRDGLHLLLMTAGVLGLGLFFKTQQKRYLGLLLVSVLLLTWEWGAFALLQFIPPLLILLLMMGSYRLDSPRFWLGTALLAVGLFLFGLAVMRVSIFHNTIIAELEPLNTETIIQYATLAVPLVFGFKRSDGFAVSWLLSFVVVGFFASRLSVYAAAPACVVGANGLDILWQRRSEWRYVFAAGCLMYLGLCWKVPQNMAMPNDWHDALIWVKENTGQDDQVAAWWSYGWWIMDVADRTPVATQATDDPANDVAAVYYAPTPKLGRSIMEAEGWDYLIVSTREQHFMDAIRARVDGVEGDGPYYEAVMSGAVSTVYRNDTVAVVRVKG